jgi:hypothetical protein
MLKLGSILNLGRLTVPVVIFHLLSGGEFEPGLHHRPTSIDIQVKEFYFFVFNSSLVPQI